MVSGFCRIMLFYGFLVKSLNIYTFVLVCLRLRGWVIEYKLGKNPENSASLLRNYEDKINSKYIESFTSQGHPKIRYLNKTNIICY